MFKQVYFELRECFGQMLKEYWQIREQCGVGLVGMKIMDSLPPEFTKKREELFCGYNKALLGKLNRKSSLAPYWDSLDQNGHEVEIAEAVDVFSSIESQDDFRVFLDVLSWMPAKTYNGIMREVLSEPHLQRLRSFVSQAPIVIDTSSDLDRNFMLSASGNYEVFRKLLLITMSFSTKNEKGITSLDLVKSEGKRKRIANNMLNEINQDD